jgi:hypothetical protein
MFVVIQHEVRDPATFWSIVADELDNLPDGLALLQSLPNQFGTTEFSLWKTDQMDTLQRFIEWKLGLVSRACFFPIHAGNAFGLPIAP